MGHPCYGRGGGDGEGAGTGEGARRGPPAAVYLDGIRCSHLVAPFPKEMVPLGLLVGFRYLVEALRCFAFYMLGVRLAFFRGWVGCLILSAVALPASAPLGEDAERSGGDLPRQTHTGWCLRLLAALSGTPRALGPQGIQARTPDNEVGACGGIVFASHCKEEESCPRARGLLTRAVAPVSLKIPGDSGGPQAEVGKETTGPGRLRLGGGGAGAGAAREAWSGARSPAPRRTRCSAPRFGQDW